MNQRHPYEVDSLRGRWIVVFIVGFIGCVALAFWIVEKTLRHLDASTPRVPASSLVRAAPDLTSAPRLQPTEAVDHSPAEDLEALRSREDDLFAKLGWAVDRGNHHAVISDDLIRRMIHSREGEERR